MFIRATSIFASLSWMSWKSPMGRPNWTRVFAYSTRELQALLDDPERHRRDAGPLGRERVLRRAPRRDVLRLAEEAIRPTRTSSRKSSPVGEPWSPILRSGLLCVRPGIPLSRTKLRTLRSFGSLPSSSLQMKTIVSA